MTQDMNSFWEITKRQLEEARSTVRNKERELEDSEERHQVEIKVSDDVCSANLSLHSQWEFHCMQCMLVSFPPPVFDCLQWGKAWKETKYTLSL